MTWQGPHLFNALLDGQLSTTWAWKVVIFGFKSVSIDLYDLSMLF